MATSPQRRSQQLTAEVARSWRGSPRNNLYIPYSELRRLNHLSCRLKGFLHIKRVGTVYGNRVVYYLGRKCSLLLSGKEFLKRKGGFKYWRYFLLIWRNGSGGRARRFIFKFICFGVRWLSACLPLWVCVAEWVTDCLRHYIKGSVCVGSPQSRPARERHFLLPPKRQPSFLPHHPRIRILPAQLQWHMFMFIVLVCSSVKSRSERRGRRKKREE